MKYSMKLNLFIFLTCLLVPSAFSLLHIETTSLFNSFILLGIVTTSFIWLYEISKRELYGKPRFAEAHSNKCSEFKLDTSKLKEFYSDDDPMLFIHPIEDDKNVIDSHIDFMSWCKKNGLEPRVSAHKKFTEETNINGVDTPEN